MSTVNCIERLCEAFPQHRETYLSFLDLYNRRLWYQLTVALLAFTQKEENYAGNNMIILYEGFLVNCESRFDPMEYAMLVCNISRQYYPDFANTLEFIRKIGDVGEAKAVFRTHVSTANKVTTNDKSKMTRRDVIGEEAFCRYVLEVAWLFVKLSQTDMAREYLDEVKSLLDHQPTPSARLYSVYYRVSMELFRSIGDVDRIYLNSIKWLAYTPLSSMTTEDKTVIVRDVIKCALLSQEVYSFGELLTAEIREIAAQGGYPWLYELLYLVNKGEVSRWNQAKELYKSLMMNDESFQGKMGIVDEKVALLALLELVFHRPTTERMLRFAEVAECCQIAMKDIEPFLIRGADLGLFKCKINQLQQQVVFTWLKPRILDNEQVQTVNKMMNQWSQRIHDTLLYVTKVATEN